MYYTITMERDYIRVFTSHKSLELAIKAAKKANKEYGQYGFRYFPAYSSIDIRRWKRYRLGISPFPELTVFDFGA